jgi:hypothetical protein
MLGKYQRSELDKLADSLVQHNNVRVEFYAFDYRPYTREAGSGHLIAFQAFECYEEADYKFGYRTPIANVKSESNIQEKIKELTGYLIERGVDRGQIKAQRVRGRYF